jgi:hypothetical protein
MVKIDFIEYNRLNSKYQFYNIIIFDPVSGDILFDNGNKYLYSTNSDFSETYGMIKEYHFGCDIKYYKKRLQTSFLKGTTFPFLSSNFSYKKSNPYSTSSVLAIPAQTIGYKVVNNKFVSDEYNINAQAVINATISLYVESDKRRSSHNISCVKSKYNYTERGLIVKKISDYLYAKCGVSYELIKLYEIIRLLHDKEIRKEVSTLIRDIKIREILE